MANILKQIKIGNTTYNIEPATNYLPVSGGSMTGAIYYKGTKATYGMIKWIDNTSDNYGNGIRIGGGGATIIGGGESSDLPNVSGGDEILYLMNDGAIDFYSNCQEGLNSAQHMTFDVYGTLNVPTNVVGSSNSNRLIFRHLDGQNCNGDYNLYLQYHQRNTKIYLNGTDYYIENGSYYNGTAAAANSVAWGNVTGKPSTFTPSGHTHDDRYYTESEINTKLNGKSNTDHTHSYLPLSGGALTGTLLLINDGAKFSFCDGWYITNIEAGSKQVTLAGTTGKETYVDVTYKNGSKGSGTWYMVATANGNHSDNVSIGLSNITNTGFRLWVRNVYSASSRTFTINWIAIKYW